MQIMKTKNFSRLSCVILSTFLSISSASGVDVPDDYVYIPMIEEGKAWHYEVNYWSDDSRSYIYENVKLVLQEDVEWRDQTWKQCWYMSEEDKLLAKTPVALLREENKIVYIYPIFNSSTFYDRSGKYSWNHHQQCFMTFFKNYINVDVSNGSYPKESPEEINEVYPAVLYDFNMKPGDSMASLDASHWAYVKDRGFGVSVSHYVSNCSRTYKKTNVSYKINSDVIPSIYEGIGAVTSSYDSNSTFFICPIPVYQDNVPCFPKFAKYPQFLYVTDRDGKVIFQRLKPNQASNSRIESESIKLNCIDGTLTISGPGNELYSLSLYDMRGNTLYNGNISVDTPVCVSDQLLPGIYIAVAEGAGYSSRLKFEVKGM